MNPNPRLVLVTSSRMTFMFLTVCAVTLARAATIVSSVVSASRPRRIRAESSGWLFVASKVTQQSKGSSDKFANSYNKSVMLVLFSKTPENNTLNEKM